MKYRNVEDMSWQELRAEMAALKSDLMSRSPKYKRMLELESEYKRIKELAKRQALKSDKEKHFDKKSGQWAVKYFSGQIPIEGKKIDYEIKTRNVPAKEAHIQRPFYIV